jgi:hypothetical protein
MLTIQNINKIVNKSLGKKNFYVARVEEQFSIDNLTYGPSQHQYKFELSNRKYAITVTLDREGRSSIQNEMVYTLNSSTGNVVYLMHKEINNMDIFIDKLRLVALG